MTAQPDNGNPRLPAVLTTSVPARVLRHDPHYGLSTLIFADGELRVPLVDRPAGAAVKVEIEARDVAIALSRPMDVSITNRLPGAIVALDRLEAPYALVTFDLGSTKLLSLVTWESVDRLALETGLRAWAMVKTVAIRRDAIVPDTAPTPAAWPPVR